MKHSQKGFTLVELSIVLVIIGLIVAGIVMGADLVGSMEARSTITQLEKYRTAVNAFQSKYNDLPGDIPNPKASTYGFLERGASPGMGDGNRVLQGNLSNGTASDHVQGRGELVMVWVDLSTAGMIEETFNTASPSVLSGAITDRNVMALHLPRAKLGKDNFFFLHTLNGVLVAAISGIFDFQAGGAVRGTPMMPVWQAHYIDSKIDDGEPLNGGVKAMIISGGSIASANGAATLGGFASFAGPTDNSATAASSTRCMHNRNTGGAIQQYALDNDGGDAQTCALRIKF